MTATTNNQIDCYGVLLEARKVSEDEFIYGQYPKFIKDALAQALSVHIAKNDVTDPKEITSLSELVDDVAFNIDINMRKMHILRKQGA